VDDLLRQLDGRTVRRFDGRTTVLRTAGAEKRQVGMTRRQRFLSAIAHPQIAYLLLTLGMLGLTVELWNPGGILPGVAGGVCLLLAFFALQILPVNATGLLLIAFGIGLLLLELKMPSFGILGIGGVVSLVMGSVMTTRSIPDIRVNLAMVVPAALGLAAVMLLLGRLALKAQRQQAVTGAEGLVGRLGHTRTAVGPDTPGHVSVHGEIWQAVSHVGVAAGEPVRITAVRGLTLEVEPAGAAPQGGYEWKA
jgi:membrane-bound serine protease (ClpP class)